MAAGSRERGPGRVLGPATVVLLEAQRDCLAALSPDLQAAAGATPPAGLSLQLHREDGATGHQACYLHWPGSHAVLGPAAPRAAVGLSPALALSLALAEGDQVLLECLGVVVPCLGLHARVQRRADWDGLASHAGAVERSLLHQCKLVWAGLTLPVWLPGRHAAVLVEVVSTTPSVAPVVRLSARTELSLEPPPDDTASATSFEHEDRAPPLQFTARAHPASPCEGSRTRLGCSAPTHVGAMDFASTAHPAFADLEASLVLCIERASVSAKPRKRGGSEAEGPATVIVVHCPHVPRKHILLPTRAWEALGFAALDLVGVSAAREVSERPYTLHCPPGTDEDVAKCKTEFRAHLVRGPVAVTHGGTAVALSGDRAHLVTLSPSIIEAGAGAASNGTAARALRPGTFFWARHPPQSVAHQCNIANSPAMPPESRQWGLPDTLDDLPEPAQELQGLLRVSMDLRREGRGPRQISHLLHGPSGSGKTTVLRRVLASLCSAELLHSEWVACSQVFAKRTEAVCRTLRVAAATAERHAPSALVLEDLHLILGAPEDDHGQGAPGGQARVANQLRGLVRRIAASDTGVWLIATCTDASRLVPSVFEDGIFEAVHLVQPPNLPLRQRILSRRLERGGALQVALTERDFSDAARRTDGYLPTDLEALARQAIHQAALDAAGPGGPVTLRASHIDRALAAVVPVSLLGLKANSSERTFADIGGMAEVKQMMVEMFAWPVRFPLLFQDCPLRVPSGLLLYGPPGCGKTFIAGAAARECGLRFISVKAAELLSKYIGASEQAVRRLFQQAQTAAPCLLFFDEFDALAPRRGHDSTGVTDRVVNQLLTQLDGVEALRGVHVLAATSRPDLIDPALLRPGRLDRSVLCDFPDLGEREATLGVLSSSIPLAATVDLGAVAAECEFFSGADLSAVLANAESAGTDNDAPPGPLQQHELLQAARALCPSVSEQERARFEQILQRFTGRGPREPSEGTRAAGTRATLA